jgi:hypothetical protein
MQFQNGTLIGILFLLDLCMIGRWKWFLGSLSCCILNEQGMEVRIQFAGLLLSGNHLKLKSYY